ncbi:hypothetical protein GGF50DRAFT_86409 [Schizophyllum commune]
MRTALWCLACALSLVTGVASQQSSAGFTPLWLPLAVRTPHLNAWVRSDTTTWADSPFGAADHILAWAGYVRVDGTVYTYTGTPFANATTSQVWRVTPSRTIQTSQAGPVQLTVTWLSPIEPDDLVKQSMPFVYMSVKAASTDGSSHSVELYSDVTGEWLSSDLSTLITWSETTAASAIYHKAAPVSPTSMAETSDIAEDATLYFGMAKASALTWQSGFADDVRGQFNKSGSLLDEGDDAHRAIQDRWPVFSLSWDLGDVDDNAKEAVWAMGLARSPVVQYTSGSSSEGRYPYYLTEYSNADDAFEAFIADYDDAATRADSFDAKIMSAAGSVSSNYADLIALGTRQTFAGAEFTVSQGDNSYDAGDVLAFMKQSGDSERVNAVETLYASWPAFLYVNATWAGYLLEPLLRFQSSNVYTKDFAAPDLGTSYPSATGNKSPGSSLAVEACGDMLIMAFSQAQMSGDGTLLGKYYDTFKGWADYLVLNAASPPGSQKLPGGADGADNANLALKGIIGLQAMAGISTAVQKLDDATVYSNNATSMIDTWADELQSNNLADPSHTGLMYNLFADRLMKSEMIPDDAYATLKSAYTATGVEAAFGISFDGSSSVARSGAFPAAYDDTTGVQASGQASPAQGAVFAALALGMSTTTITVPASASPTSSSSSKHKSVAGPIAGGVVGGLAFIAIVGGAVWFFLRRRADGKPEGMYDLTEGRRGATPQEIKPFYGYEGASASYVPGQPYAAGQAPQGYQPQLSQPGFASVPGYSPAAVVYSGAQYSGVQPQQPGGPYAQPDSSRGSWVAVDAAQGQAQAQPEARPFVSAMEEKRRLRAASNATSGVSSAYGAGYGAGVGGVPFSGGPPSSVSNGASSSSGGQSSGAGGGGPLSPSNMASPTSAKSPTSPSSSAPQTPAPMPQSSASLPHTDAQLPHGHVDDAYEAPPPEYRHAA